MISRRNYLAAVMLMVVLMFLLMGSNVLRDEWNDFSVNIHIGDQTELAAKTNPIWYDDMGRSTTGAAVFVGGGDSRCQSAAEEWAAYSRHDYTAFPSLKAYRASGEEHDSLDMLIIDAAALDWAVAEDTEYLTECAEDGTNIVFCTLPATDVIRNNAALRNLLGIRGIAAEERPVNGLFLYAGFLLGGEKLYMPSETDKEEQIVFPGDTDKHGRPILDWFLLGPGTKVYMRGIPNDETVRQDEYPPLIWRRSLDTSYVFAVNGGYMEGIDGTGILAAMAAESSTYSLYPVVNGQDLVLINYPMLSDENEAEMQRLYSRSATDVYQELLWGDIQQAGQRYHYKASCMMTPELDYTDDIMPDPRQLEYYLKIFNETSAEAGLSLVGTSDTPVRQKVEEDQRFFDGATDYVFSAVYSGSMQMLEIEPILSEPLLRSVDTVVQEYQADPKLLSRISDTVTGQASMNTDFSCTYKQDFQLRCVQTALGYTSIAYDFSRIAYPQSDEDGWERLSREFRQSIGDYGRAFTLFEKTTVSESSARVRTLLATKYTDSREDDTIHVQTEGAENAKWFVLRTHNDVVVGVDGGGFTELEDGAYLIRADEDDFSIHLSLDDRTSAS